jgi:hypothetical protein
MKALTPIGLALLALSGLSCSSKSSDASAAAAADTITMASTTPYTLQPGDEKYFCYATTLQEDMVFNGFAPTYGKGTHHILLAEAIAAEPEGFAECNVLFKTTWIPLFVGGKGTQAVKFPEGTGYKVPKGTQILLQLHLQNPDVAAITDTTKVVMEKVAAGQPFTPAGIFGMDNRAIAMAPNQTGYSTEMTCAPDNKTLNVFSTFAHMHKHGQHISVTRNDSEVVYDSAWNFDLQTAVPKTLSITPADKLKLKCTYDNPTSKDVKYGESSDDEMCAFVFYYTPFDKLDGCIKDK